MSGTGGVRAVQAAQKKCAHAPGRRLISVHDIGNWKTSAIKVA
jgi:hypothetical protein